MIIATKYYTVSQKTSHSTFIDNFDKMLTNFQNFLLSESSRNLQQKWDNISDTKRVSSLPCKI